MGGGNFQVIEHRDRVVAEMLVAVGVRIRNMRRDVTARRIGDAAVAAREVAHLRLPARIVSSKLMDKKDRRALARLLEIKLHIVWRRDVWHFALPSLVAPKIAVNVYGGNEDS